MTAFSFKPLAPPFPRWWGPYSPSRGKYTGIRVRAGTVGAWVTIDDCRAFWSFPDTAGARSLSALVQGNWGGGRVLLTPDGSVVKPLQDVEVGERVVIGSFAGAVVFIDPNGDDFDLSDALFAPGMTWTGPDSTGLGCVIQSDGSIKCTWSHPAPHGCDEVTETLFNPNEELRRGFAVARPGVAAGRVQVLEHGHVVTKVESSDGTWDCRYVGRLPSGRWANRKEWVERRSK